MIQPTTKLVTDERTIRLVITADDPAAPDTGHRTEYTLEVCPSPTCHCCDMTMVRTPATATDLARPAEFLLDPFEHTVVATAVTRSATDLLPPVPPGPAIAAAIATEDWTRLRHAFFAAKATAFATIDCSREVTEFPFAEVERHGTLVPLRHIIPFAPSFAPPTNDSREFLVDEQYCARPGCDCTESVVGLHVCLVEDASSPRKRAEPLVDFQVDWRHNRWRIAGATRPLTAEEEGLRDRLLAANPNLLAELRRRHEIMHELYEASAAAFRVGVSIPYRAAPRIGRNDPCPCGSGRKYKRCCLLKQDAATT
ncbi:MAG TPA: SEC-C metal-binding domain-containing protein [Planctomycetota bacterium]|nr:SEC-C metal-binding domain-containing protein [Planctomycetota bacterium]